MYDDKPMSLVERKKLQWAKEREELAACFGPWGQRTDYSKSYDRRFNCNVSNGNPYRQSNRDANRSSLPPLYKNQYNSSDLKYDRESGDTSGYGSGNHTPDFSHVTNWNTSGYESSSSRDDRPKWGDKGVGVGKYWQPKEDRVPASEPPNWVKRGLQDGEIVVSSTSPSESPEQDRPLSAGSSNFTRSFIRGQNMPIDSAELAERERRRQIALAHQEAVRQQLEERERKKLEEKQKRIKEEQEEDLRIEKEQEIERQRKENELRALKEKQDREEARKAALREALELAEKAGQLEKQKKRKNQANYEMKENLNNDPINNDSDTNKLNNNMIFIPPNSSDKSNQITEEVNNVDFNMNNNNLKNQEKDIETKESICYSKNNLAKEDTNKNNNEGATGPKPEKDYQPIIFPPPLDMVSNYAIILPAALGIPAPMAIPIIRSDIGTPNTSRTENRILTPTQYRIRERNFCDSSTQTENERDKLVTADGYDTLPRSRKDKRTNRSEGERRGDSLEERPKWGANRPPTRYMKQSEKDLSYQKKKLRQKNRNNNKYEDKNSSDESLSATPRLYRRKIEKRSRALWRKNGEFVQGNIKMYQTEIVPLESDKDIIYYKEKCCCRCRCDKTRMKNVDILKIDHSPRQQDEAILSKLNSLQNGLMMKQEKWKNTPRTPQFSN